MARKRSDVVLVRKGQATMSMDEAARQVAATGFKAVAAKLGVGESTLRTIMAEEGYRFKRSTTWQVEQLPGMDGEAAPSGPPVE